MFEHLEGKADAYSVCVGKLGKEAIVIALATSKTRAVAAECHAGDDSKVYFVVRIHGKDFARWLHYAVGSWLQ